MPWNKILPDEFDFKTLFVYNRRKSTYFAHGKIRNCVELDTAAPHLTHEIYLLIDSLLIDLHRNSDEEGDENRPFYYGDGNRSSGPPLYPHNTYHGPGLGYNQHQRTPLAQANFRPLKFTDKYSPRTSNSMNNGDPDAIQDEVSSEFHFRWPRESASASAAAVSTYVI